MFLININSFPTSSPDVKNANHHQFADYTTHIISPLDTTKNNLASQIDETLLSAEDYCNSINVKINKTISQQTLNIWKFPHFKQLHQRTCKKLLGGIYDKHQNWNQHLHTNSMKSFQQLYSPLEESDK